MNRLGSRTRTTIWPLLLLGLLTLLLTWPTAATLSTHVIDRQDPLLNAWIMAWEARQLLLAPLHLYDSNIFFPLHNTLAFSEILLSTSALVMPLQWFTGDALLSYNVAYLLAFFTTALGGYLLALYLTGHRSAALVAAVAFAWSPYRLGQMSQVQLLYFGWLPVALIYLDRLLRGSPRVRWVREGGMFGLFFLLQALASFYAALFSAITCGLYLVGWFLWRHRLAWRSVAGVMVGASLVAVVMLPLVLPYFEVQRTLGAGWTLQMNEQFSASLQAYAYAPEGTRLWGPLTRPLRYTYGPCCPPSTLFPGLTLLALSGVALGGGMRGRGGGRRWLWMGIGAVAFGLSLGPTLTLRALEPTGITLPYRWLWEWVPGFDAIRAPVRWAVLLTLALSMLGALGVARLRARWVPPLALALVLLEFAVVPLPVVPAPAPPASLDWLDAQPPTRIVELPLVAERPRPETSPDEPRLAWERSRLLEAQFFSTVHWHTTPDGYSGYVPTRHGDFAREMASFPSDRSVALLQGLGVRYVILREAELDAARAARLAGPLPVGLSEVARFDGERVLEVAPAPPAPHPTLELPLNTLPTGALVLPLLLRAADAPYAPYVPVAGTPLELEATWSGGGEAGGVERVLVEWPMIVEEIALLHVPLQSPSPGEWQLTLSGRFPDGSPLLLETTVEVRADAARLPQLLPVSLERVEWVDERTVELTWYSRQPLTRYYSLSARLLAPDGTLMAQRDGWPSEEGTLAWQPGSRHSARWTFDLPPDAPRATRLVVHWYDPEVGGAVWLWSGVGRGFVGEVGW